MRLDKYICKSTELTRAQASEALLNKRVKVDQHVFTNGAVQVHDHNNVTLDEVELKRRPYRYLLMHKPANTLCSNIDENYPSIFNYIDIPYKTDLHIVGRLDADTTGLVLITDDGSWTYKIIKPEAQCEKVYRIILRDKLSTEAASKLEQGLILPGLEKITLPAKVELIKPKEILLTLTEGRFHQVKRMLRAVGNRVKHLHREKIGEVQLDVELGLWRYLDDAEINSFR